MKNYYIPRIYSSQSRVAFVTSDREVKEKEIKIRCLQKYEHNELVTLGSEAPSQLESSEARAGLQALKLGRARKFE